MVEQIIVIASAIIFLGIMVVLFRETKVIEKSHNSTRLADLTSISTAVNLYLADNHDFSVLQTGATYESVTSSKSAKRSDGTGWIPLDFAAVTSGTPLAALPVDPINDKAKGYYYRFGVKVAEKTYEVDCAFESADDADKQSSDGGNNPSRFEMGTDLSILP